MAFNSSTLSNGRAKARNLLPFSLYSPELTVVGVFKVVAIGAKVRIFCDRSLSELKIMCIFAL